MNRNEGVEMQWWGKALEDWTKLLLGSRRRVFVWGCIPALILSLWTFFKILLWAAGVAVLVVIGLVGGLIYLVSGGGRQRRAY